MSAEPKYVLRDYGVKPRPTADETWMAVAESVALRSRCDLAQVGAVVLAPDGRVVSTGYNGPPHAYPGEGQCINFCVRAQTRDRTVAYGLTCPTVHAEANALISGDRASWLGGTMYVTRSCCADCAKLIANSGLARIVMTVTDDDMHRAPATVVDFLEKCGLVVETVSGLVELTERKGT